MAAFRRIKSLAEAWQPQHIVIDATGVGEGLWALLEKFFPTRLVPVKFTQQEKSAMGWRFLAVIETGRFRDFYANSPLQISRRKFGEGSGVGWVDPDQVRLQYDACQSEILPGPAKTLRWGVPDGTRDPGGELVHDDYVLADSLAAKLDELQWQFHSETLIIQGQDPLESMSHF